MSGDLEAQRRITRLALAAAGDDTGFALAGSGAIREHGLIDRPTEDVDLFTVQQTEDGFGQAVDRIMAALREAGYTLDVRRRLATFAQLAITDPQGRVTDLDLGVDWRANPPVVLEVGAVLALDDAVANKIAALFSRAETRDYLDVDAIRRSGRFTDAELLALGEQADAGFDREQFAAALDAIRRIEPEEVGVYRVTAGALAGIKHRMTTWAASLRVADQEDISAQ